MLNKKGKATGMEIFVGLILLVLVLQVVGVVDFKTMFAAKGEVPVTPAVAAIEGACSDPTNTITWGAVSKKWSPSTTISASAGTSVRYYMNDGIGSTSTSGSTKGATYRDAVEGLYSYGTSTDTAYYPNYFKFTMPCGSIDTKTIEALGIGTGSAELLANGTVTFDVFNSDTNNKNSGNGGDNESIGTGDTGRFTVKISTLDKTGISTPGGKYMIVAEVNKSMYDESTLTLGGRSGIQVPQSYVLSNTDSYAVGWEFPACPIGDKRFCNEDLGTLSLNSDASENPIGSEGTAATAAARIGLGDIKLTVLDQSYGKNTLTDKIIGPAYVDDVGAALGLLGATGQSAYLSVD